MSGCRLGDLWQLDIGQALFLVHKNKKTIQQLAFSIRVTYSRKGNAVKIQNKYFNFFKVKKILIFVELKYKKKGQCQKKVIYDMKINLFLNCINYILQTHTHGSSQLSRVFPHYPEVSTRLMSSATGCMCLEAGCPWSWMMLKLPLTRKSGNAQIHQLH